MQIKSTPQRKKETTINISSSFLLTPIDPNIKNFTEVDRYYTDTRPTPKNGIVDYYSLSELTTRLNHYKKQGQAKLDNPAILKGIYRGGTSGQYCIKGSQYLPLDIDVKVKEDKKENESLFYNQVANLNVFNYLQKILPLVWRSNSGYGIAGFIYVPSLQNTNFKNDTATHKLISEQIYKTIEDLIYQNVGINVKLDNAQGSFRQIRLLAEQTEPREINPTPLQFDYTIKETYATNPDNIPLFYRPKSIDPRYRTIKETFNQNNNINNTLLSLGFEFISNNRVKHHTTSSTTSGIIKPNDNVFVNFSGSLADLIGTRKRELTPFDLVCGLQYSGQYSAFISDLKSQGYKEHTPPKKEALNEAYQLKRILISKTENDPDQLSEIIFSYCYKFKTAPDDVKHEIIKIACISTDLKKHFYQHLGLNKSNTIFYDQNLKAKRYVSEVISEIISISEKHNKILLKAETGTGKTTAIIKDFRKLKPDTRCLLIAPLTIIVDQLKSQYRKEDIIFLTGQSTFRDHAEAQSANFVVATYEQGIKHLRDSNNTFDYVFIDEAHQLINSNSYKTDVISQLTEMFSSDQNYKIVGLSGTPSRLFSHLGYHLVSIDFENILKVPVTVRYSNKKPLDIVLNHVNKSGRYIFRINEITALEDIKKNVIEKGIFKENEVLILHSSFEIKNSKDFKQLYQKSKFHNSIKLVLTTSIIDEGLSIDDDFTDSVFISTNHAPEAEPVKQFFARFRSSDHKDLFTHRKNYLYLKYTKEKRKDTFLNVSRDFEDKLTILKENPHEPTTHRDFTDPHKFYYNQSLVNVYYLANHCYNQLWRQMNEPQFLDYLSENYNILPSVDTNYQLSENNAIRSAGKSKKEDINHLLKEHFFEVVDYLRKHSLDKNLTGGLCDMICDFEIKRSITVDHKIRKRIKDIENVFRYILSYWNLSDQMSIFNENEEIKPINKLNEELFSNKIITTINAPVTPNDQKLKFRLIKVVDDLKETGSFRLDYFIKVLKNNEIYNFDRYNKTTLESVLNTFYVSYSYDKHSKIYTIC